MAEILVTGASGFVGTNLCRRLSESGHDVTGLDANEPPFELPDSVELTVRDLTAKPSLPDVDVIAHLAGHAQVQQVIEAPRRAVENVETTNHVLTEAARTDAAVVFTSSRDIYGATVTPSESEVTLDAPNGYAASKIGCEALGNAYRNTRNVSFVALRLANVYGPMDLNRRVIPTFVALAEAGEELGVYGRGKILDFVHVRDACRAIATAVQRPHAIDGEAINVGSGVGTPLSAVAETVASEVDTCPGWRIESNRTGDVSRYVSDLGRARALLDYEPRIGLERGLSETVEWYLDRPEVLATLRETTSGA